MHTVINGDTLIVESGGTLSSSFAGHPSRQGPGAGTSTHKGGSYASHGGNAGESSVYGHFNDQFQPGSGGSSGSGGALVELNIGKEVIIDGSVYSKGQDVSANNGAGSGGCVVIRTFDLRGKGAISVDGGMFLPIGPFRIHIYNIIIVLIWETEHIPGFVLLLQLLKNSLVSSCVFKGA